MFIYIYNTWCNLVIQLQFTVCCYLLLTVTLQLNFLVVLWNDVYWLWHRFQKTTLVIHEGWLDITSSRLSHCHLPTLHPFPHNASYVIQTPFIAVLFGNRLGAKSSVHVSRSQHAIRSCASHYPVIYYRGFVRSTVVSRRHFCQFRVQFQVDGIRLMVQRW